MEEIARLQQKVSVLLEEAGHRTKTEVWCMPTVMVRLLQYC